jgi:radical SAM superfamily enzyme YgiQ (UPF0313 family)
VRSAANVVSEIKEYTKKYSIENVDFYDLTPIVKRDWIIEFCNMLLESRLDITWQLPSGTRAEALGSEVTDLLYKSGCRNLSYAPESGSPETLTRIKKKVKLDGMIKSMKGSVANKINIKANIIIGFPQENLKDILKTYKFIARMAIAGVHDVSVWTFSAYPGSEIFENLKRAKRLPEFKDDYFLSLLSYSDLKKATSWNERFSDRQLNYMRLFGMVLFYSLSYLLRPVRFVRNIRNLIRHKPQSRLEMIMEKAIYRHRQKGVQ